MWLPLLSNHALSVMSVNDTEPAPILIQGGHHVDERGRVSFVNGFDFQGVDRFYWVEAGQADVPRGWVGQGGKLKAET